MFLCLVTEDWDTAEKYRTSAEFVWRMVHTGHLEQGAQDKKMESMLAELREGLDHLKVLQYETKPDSWLKRYAQSGVVYVVAQAWRAMKSCFQGPHLMKYSHQSYLLHCCHLEAMSQIKTGKQTLVGKTSSVC